MILALIYAIILLVALWALVHANALHVPNGDRADLAADVTRHPSDRGGISVLELVAILIGACAVVWLVKTL